MAALAGLHHAALSVKDLDASVAWYQDVLGLEESFRQEFEDRRSVVLTFPGLPETLGLVEHHGDGEGFDAVNLGLDHLAFRVFSGEELAAWPGRLDEHGIPHSGPLKTPVRRHVVLQGSRRHRPGAVLGTDVAQGVKVTLGVVRTERGTGLRRRCRRRWRRDPMRCWGSPRPGCRRSRWS